MTKGNGNGNSFNNIQVPCTIIPGVPPTPFQHPSPSSLRLDGIQDILAASSITNHHNVHRNNAMPSIGSLFEQNFQVWKRPVSDVLPLAAGTLAFTAFLSLSTLLQFKLKISTGTPAPIPSLFGLGSVATAAFCSHIVSIKSYQLVQHNPHRNRYAPSYNEHYRHSNTHYGDPWQSPIDLNLGNKQNAAHALRVCALGLLAYKGLGGRFWSIAPSNLTNLGSYARTIFSIPATSKYANPAQRKAIERLGRTIGCHTCGSRNIVSRSKNGVKFIADHMPPQSAVKQMEGRWFRRLFGVKVKQKFYPQCTKCSDLQGGILSEATRKKFSNLANAGGGKYAFNHGGKFRLEHLAGGLVAAATVWDAREEDVLGRTDFDGGTHSGTGGNRRRFLEWQIHVMECWDSIASTVNDIFDL